MAHVIEDADSLRAVRGHGVLLLRDDAPLSRRGTNYFLGDDAVPVPPALAASSSKFGVMFVSSMTGVTLTRASDVEQAMNSATGLTEMELKTAAFPVHLSLELTPAHGPASILALSPSECFLAVAQGGSVHIFWVPGAALRAEKIALAQFKPEGGSIASLSWSDSAVDGAPELLVCTHSAVRVYSHTGKLLASCATQATSAEWLRLREGSSSSHLVLGTPDGSACSAKIDYATAAIVLDASASEVFTANRPDIIAGVERELHFLCSPKAGLLLAGWRPVAHPPADTQPPLVLAVFEQRQNSSSNTVGMWDCVVLDAVCPVDENDPAVDLSRQQFSAITPAPGWDVVTVASNMSNEVALLGRGTLSGSEKAGKRDSASWFHWLALNDRFAPRTLESEVDFLQTRALGICIDRTSTQPIPAAAAGLRGSAQPLSAGPVLQILCSSGVIVPFHLASISAVLPAPPPVTPEVSYSNPVPPARTHAATPVSGFPSFSAGAGVSFNALSFPSTTAAPPPPVSWPGAGAIAGSVPFFAPPAPAPSVATPSAPAAAQSTGAIPPFEVSASIPSFGGGSLNGGAAFPSFGNSSAGVSFGVGAGIPAFDSSSALPISFGGTASLSFLGSSAGAQVSTPSFVDAPAPAPRKKSSSTAASAEAKPGGQATAPVSNLPAAQLPAPASFGTVTGAPAVMPTAFGATAAQPDDSSRLPPRTPASKPKASAPAVAPPQSGQAAPAAVPKPAERAAPPPVAPLHQHQLPDLRSAPRHVTDMVESMTRLLAVLSSGGCATDGLQYLSSAEQRWLDDTLSDLASTDAPHGVPALQRLASTAAQESKAKAAAARARLQFTETHLAALAARAQEEVRQRSSSRSLHGDDAPLDPYSANQLARARRSLQEVRHSLQQLDITISGMALDRNAESRRGTPAYQLMVAKRAAAQLETAAEASEQRVDAIRGAINAMLYDHGLAIPDQQTAPVALKSQVQLQHERVVVVGSPAAASRTIGGGRFGSPGKFASPPRKGRAEGIGSISRSMLTTPSPSVSNTRFAVESSAKFSPSTAASARRTGVFSAPRASTLHKGSHAATTPSDKSASVIINDASDTLEQQMDSISLFRAARFGATSRMTTSSSLYTRMAAFGAQQRIDGRETSSETDKILRYATEDAGERATSVAAMAELLWHRQNASSTVGGTHVVFQRYRGVAPPGEEEPPTHATMPSPHQASVPKTQSETRDSGVKPAVSSSSVSSNAPATAKPPLAAHQQSRVTDGASVSATTLSFAAGSAASQAMAERVVHAASLPPPLTEVAVLVPTTDAASASVTALSFVAGSARQAKAEPVARAGPHAPLLTDAAAIATTTVASSAPASKAVTSVSQISPEEEALHLAALLRYMRSHAADKTNLEAKAQAFITKYGPGVWARLEAKYPGTTADYVPRAAAPSLPSALPPRAPQAQVASTVAAAPTGAVAKALAFSPGPIGAVSSSSSAFSLTQEPGPGLFGSVPTPTTPFSSAAPSNSVASLPFGSASSTSSFLGTGSVVPPVFGVGASTSASTSAFGTPSRSAPSGAAVISTGVAAVPTASDRSAPDSVPAAPGPASLPAAPGPAAPALVAGTPAAATPARSTAAPPADGSAALAGATTPDDAETHRSALIAYYSVNDPSKADAGFVERIFRKYGTGVWEALEKKKPGSTSGYQPQGRSGAASAPASAPPSAVPPPATAASASSAPIVFGSAHHSNAPAPSPAVVPASTPAAPAPASSAPPASGSNPSFGSFSFGQSSGFNNLEGGAFGSTGPFGQPPPATVAPAANTAPAPAAPAAAPPRHASTPDPVAVAPAMAAAAAAAPPSVATPARPQAQQAPVGMATPTAVTPPAASAPPAGVPSGLFGGGGGPFASTSGSAFGAAGSGGAGALFGQQQVQQQPQQAAPPAAPAAGLFGGGAPAQAPPTVFGGFGAASAAAPTFGAPTPAPAFGAPSFGSTPAFGSPAAQVTFGSTPAFGSPAAQVTFGPGSFGPPAGVSPSGAPSRPAPPAPSPTDPQHKERLLAFFTAHKPANASQAKVEEFWSKYGKTVWHLLDAKYPGKVAQYAQGLDIPPAPAPAAPTVAAAPPPAAPTASGGIFSGGGLMSALGRGPAAGASVFGGAPAAGGFGALAAQAPAPGGFGGGFSGFGGGSAAAFGGGAPAAAPFGGTSSTFGSATSTAFGAPPAGAPSAARFSDLSFGQGSGAPMSFGTTGGFNLASAIRR